MRIPTQPPGRTARVHAIHRHSRTPDITNRLFQMARARRDHRVAVERLLWEAIDLLCGVIHDLLEAADARVPPRRPKR
jgi:hypothetical protein